MSKLTVVLFLYIMEGNVFETLSVEQKLRLSVQKDVKSICQEAAHYVGLDVDSDAVELIGDLVWRKVQVFGSDLECFAKHAKRSTVAVDDVKLLVRRNPSLLSHVNKLAEELSTSNVKKGKDLKRKRSNVNVAQTTDVTRTKYNADPSTSSVAPQRVTNVADENSDSEDSPFVRMLHKRITERQMNVKNDEEDVIDLSD